MCEKNETFSCFHSLLLCFTQPLHISEKTKTYLGPQLFGRNGLLSQCNNAGQNWSTLYNLQLLSARISIFQIMNFVTTDQQTFKFLISSWLDIFYQLLVGFLYLTSSNAASSGYILNGFSIAFTSLDVFLTYF